MKNETLTAILNEKDKLSAYMGVGVDYYKGETGKSGADEVYIGPEPPTDPEVKLWVDTEDQSADVVNWDDVENKPNFATVATSGSYEDLTNKPTIPEPYTLPTASTDTLGGVKVDGTTITIADGVISSAGGDLIGKKIKGYRQPESEWTWMADWAQHPEKYYVIVEGVSDANEEGPVIRTYVSNNSFYYYWFEDDTLHRGYINFTDNTLSQVESVNEWPDAGTVWLTEKNRWAYIPEPDLTPYAKTADLSTVATSGSYEDLKNKPNLFSGDYQDLTNKPTIPQPYTLPTASYNTLGGVKVSQTDSSKKYGIVYIDSEARLRVPIARQGASANAGIVLPNAIQFKVEDDGNMFLLPASTNIGGVKADGTTTITDEDGTIHAVIPEPYTLPTASTTTIGGVKVDGTSITIADGVISSTQPTKTSELTNDSGFITNEYHDATKQNVLVAGDNITIADDGKTISASHPARYIDGANVSGNTLTLYYNNDTSVVFTPTGGSGGSSGGVSGYAFSSTQTFSDVDKAHLKEIHTNNNIYMTIDRLTVVRIMSFGAKRGFIVINTNGATSNQVLVYTVDIDGSGNVTSNTFTLFMSYYLAGNSSTLSGDIITTENWSQYIPVGGGDWSGPNTDQSMGDLYNVKQLWIIYQGNNTGAIMQSVLRFDYDSTASTLGGRAYQTFYLHHDDVTSNQVYIDYDGTNLNISGGSILGYFYKT